MDFLVLLGCLAIVMIILNKWDNEDNENGE
jgi:hypothetical protein